MRPWGAGAGTARTPSTCRLRRMSPQNGSPPAMSPTEHLRRTQNGLGASVRADPHRDDRRMSPRERPKSGTRWGHFGDIASALARVLTRNPATVAMPLWHPRSHAVGNGTSATVLATGPIQGRITARMCTPLRPAYSFIGYGVRLTLQVPDSDSHDAALEDPLHAE